MIEHTILAGIKTSPVHVGIRWSMFVRLYLCSVALLHLLRRKSFRKFIASFSLHCFFFTLNLISCSSVRSTRLLYEILLKTTTNTKETVKSQRSFTKPISHFNIFLLIPNTQGVQPWWELCLGANCSYCSIINCYCSNNWFCTVATVGWTRLLNCIEENENKILQLCFIIFTHLLYMPILISFLWKQAHQ